jgi:hypothetical protein
MKTQTKRANISLLVLTSGYDLKDDKYVLCNRTLEVKAFTVYGLVDPSTHTIFYVGRTGRDVMVRHGSTQCAEGTVYVSQVGVGLRAQSLYDGITMSLLTIWQLMRSPCPGGVLYA